MLKCIVARCSQGTESIDASIARIRTLIDKGFVQAAHTLALETVKRAPNLFEANLQLASAKYTIGDIAGAIELLEKCLQMRPTDLPAIMAHAQALHFSGRSADAIAACDRALMVYPNETALRLQKATVQDQSNEPEAAWRTLEPLMGSRHVSSETAGVATRVLFALDRYDDALKWGQQAAEDPRTPDKDRRTIWMHLARVCDRVGRYDDAMKACMAAHATLPDRFDANKFVNYVDSLIAMFSKSNLRMIARSTDRSQVPLFVIGMPRSGTSLVEQIIASHPLAFGAGEINDIDAIARTLTAETASMYAYPDSIADLTTEISNRLAQQYLSRLRQLGGKAQRVTNKMLEQYEHVGLIWTLFPGARVIYIRRDPFDTCLSCFTRHMNPDRVPYARSLEHLGLVYRQHERLMEHWRQTLDLPILTVQYEQIVAEQEPLTRQIIEFIGLPWSDRCLRYWETDRTVMTLSYDQVNKPIYDSSIGRWKNYEKHLKPLRNALGMTDD